MSEWRLFMMMMTTPTTAYDLLDENERRLVDEYVTYVLNEQKRRCERIALALNYPIASEYVRRSRGVLSKPLVRAALAERIRVLAEEQDISPTRVIQEHASIAFSNILDYFDPHPFGELVLKNLSDIPRDKMAAVKSIKTIPTSSGMRTEVYLHDKATSLKVMTELMGLVAPDKPPVLEGYSSSAKQEALIDQQAPEELYATLIT